MKKKYLIIFLSAITLASNAQKGIIEKHMRENQTVSFAKFKKDTVPFSLANTQVLLKQILNIGSEDNFRHINIVRDQNGFDHQYLQQYYKDVKVEFGDFTVHAKENSVESITGHFCLVKNVNTIPAITESQALQFAKQNLGATSYKWEIPSEEKWTKDNFGDSYFPKGQLLIARVEDNTNENYRLAWKFNIYAHQPLSRNYIYVDAITGAIIAKYPIIVSANSAATGATRYSGTQSFTTDSFNGSFRLRETRNGVVIQTLNMLGQGANFATAADFTDNDNNWTAAEHNNSSKDNAALDAHWAAEKVLDFWNTAPYSRNSLNNSGLSLMNFVHADLGAIFGFNNDNAVWDGQKMSYGDGATLFTPVTSLDVVAHETGHGINQFTANIIGVGESGALNEGLSDIWGAVIENWAAPSKQTWKIGEDITINAPYFLRSMNDPNSSLQPDTYNGTYWVNTANTSQQNDFGGVHANTGVSNFWFYLLSQGGTGVNDNGKCYAVTGIGITNAAQIVWQTEHFELIQKGAMNPPLSQILTLNDFRTATLSAATHLTFLTATQRQQVANAWYAVGLGASTATITGPALVCSTGTFTINNPAGTTVAWTTSNSSGLTIGSSTGIATRVGSFSGPITVTATITGSSGTSIVMLCMYVGIPAVPSILTGVGTICEGRTAQLCIYPDAGATSYSWTSNTPNVLVGGTSTCATVFGDTAPGGHITLQITNACGVRSQVYNIVVSACAGGPKSRTSLTVYPNPAASTINVALLDSLSQSETRSLTEPYQLKLINNLSHTVYSIQSSDKDIQIPLEGLPMGVYYLNVYYKGGLITRRILLSK